MAKTPSRPRTRPSFDPSRAFVALRSLPVSGVKFGPGQSFDKSLVTIRKLRQLFDNKAVGFDPDEEHAVAPVYVARRGIKLGGRDFQRGEEFPRDAVAPARLDQMMGQGLLTPTPPIKRRAKRVKRVHREVA